MTALQAWMVPPDILVSPGLYLALGLLAAAIVGVSKAGFGGGVGALATPLILVALPAPTALSLTLPVLLGCDVFTFRRFSKEWDRAAFMAIAPWMFAGLFAGLWLLVTFARNGARGDLWIKFAAGVVVTGLTALSMLPGRFAAPPGRDLRRPGPGVSAVVGLACGLTTMVAHSAGVLLNLFLLRRRPTPASFVGTSTRIYLLFNAIKIPFYVAASPLAGRTFLTWSTLGHSLWLLPAGYVGVRIGTSLHGAFSPERHRLAINGCLLVTGLYLMVSSGYALAATSAA